MSYSYATQRPFVFTEEGQLMFLKVRDKAQELMKLAGVVRLDRIIAGCTGDSWNMIACVDRLVEIGELNEIETRGGAAQYRIFVNYDWAY